MIVNSAISNGNSKTVAKFIFNKNGQETVIILKGQIAKTLIALVKAGGRGCTALEISSWALRLSAYIHILRTQYNLDIITVTEWHSGGHHGRYILKDQVQVLEVIYPSKA